jgi:hypothetical protein
MSRSLVRRFWAVVVLAGWLAGAAAPLVAGAHHDIDLACGDEAWDTPHHSSAQFERVLPPVRHDHCALCHLQRTLRGASSESGTVVPTDRGRTTAPVDDLDGVPNPVLCSLPPRAPPAIF